MSMGRFCPPKQFFQILNKINNTGIPSEAIFVPQLQFKQFSLRDKGISYFTINSIIAKMDEQTPNTARPRTLQKIENYAYFLEDKVGQGYSSHVYRGKQIELGKSLGKTVALKIMPLSKGNDFQKKLIDDQISILKKVLGNRNIIQLFDVVRNKNEVCVVTQFCEGGNLKRKIKQLKMIPEEQAMNYFRQLAIGYEPIYQSRIFHRDLKPDNILIHGETLKIADFGFAIKEEDAGNQTFLVGSPIYMPLETLKHNNYSHKGDIWALGIILFEMLTGELPFKAKSAKQLIRQINFVPAKRLVPKRISQETIELIGRILEVDPQLRISYPELKKALFPQSKLQIKLEYSIQGKTMTKFPSDNIHDIQSAKIKNKQDRADKQPAQSSKEDSEAQKTRKKIVKFQSKSTETTEKNKTTNNKELLQILISQLHFCRLFYKVLMRLNNIQNKYGISPLLKNGMAGFTMEKLEEINTLNCLSSQKVNQFCCSKYFSKINKISLEYTSRYDKQLEIFSRQEYRGKHQLLRTIQSEITRLFPKVEHLTEFSECADLVIGIDYLITILQLIRLLGRGGVKDFHTHSKIQKIVEGQPSKDIGVEQIKAIKFKIIALKLF